LLLFLLLLLLLMCTLDGWEEDQEVGFHVNVALVCSCACLCCARMREPPPRLPCAEWEYNNYRDGEVQEMVELYMARGFDEADAREVGATPSHASSSTHSGTRALCLNTTPPPYFARP
jgi:hypothetical protein